MTLTLARRKQLAAAALALTAAALWLNPAERLRTQRNAEAVREDPFSGVGQPTPATTGALTARTVDPAALSATLAKIRAAFPTARGSAGFGVLVQPDGRVRQVRLTGGALTGVAPGAVAAVLEGARLYAPASQSAPMRTLLGPIDLRGGRPG